MDQLNTDLQALQTAVANIVSDVASLSQPSSVVDPNDAVVESMVAALTSAGWTVTAPEVETPTEDAAEPSEEPTT